MPISETQLSENYRDLRPVIKLSLHSFIENNPKLMRTFEEAKDLYIRSHMAKQDLVQPQRRMNALSAIEHTIREFEPSLLSGTTLFSKFNKNNFQRQYESWKGAPLSGAEKSVIVGLYKYSE